MQFVGDVSSTTFRRPDARAYGSSSRYNARDESYMLLLELAMQEPTLQSCIKIVQSTCLAQGITMKIKDRYASPNFQSFVDRYYIPFAEEAIRHFFVLGFVPWRLRKISTGDSVPEVVPLGLFTWRIDSCPNRPEVYGIRDMKGRSSDPTVHAMKTEQLQAQLAFEKQKSFFSASEKNSNKKPRLLLDDSKKQQDEEQNKNNNRERGTPSEKNLETNTAAYHRQRQAMQRFTTHMYSGRYPSDDDQSKLLRYQITFTENCGLLENEIEIYEFVPPCNNVTRTSVLYGSVPSPLAHLLVDYRNMRQAQIRQAYADAYNLQAKLICSYSTHKDSSKMPGGFDSSKNITNPNGDTQPWNPQQREGNFNDSIFPKEVEANAYVRNNLTQKMVYSTPAEHIPIVYTLPKNTTLEQQQKLESIVDLGQIQAKFAKDVCSLMGIPFEMVSGGYDEIHGGEKKRSASNNKIFVTNMMSVCRHLKQLLIDVYLATFGGSADSIDIVIRATPRIEISTVDEICKLLDSGVVSQENAMDLSNMIFGVDLKQSMGKNANAGIFIRQFQTPKNKAGLMSAQAGMMSAEAQKHAALHHSPKNTQANKN